MRNTILTLLGAGLISGISLSLLSNSAESYKPRVVTNPFVSMAEEEEAKEGSVLALKHMYALKANQYTGRMDAKDVYAAIAQADAVSAQYKGNAANLVWEEMGPNNIGGRTRAFLIDRDSNNVLYAGGVGGGLWKSRTGGQSWVKVTPTNQDNIAVVSICQTSNGDLFVGTGEQVFSPFDNGSGPGLNGAPGFIGTGIWKSTNRGETWTKLANTVPGTSTNLQWINVSSLATSPDGNRVYAATMQGVYYSDNGGSSWTSTATLGFPSTACTEIKVATDGTVFAAVSNRIYRSDNGVTTYTQRTIPGSSGSTRMSIAISPQDPNYVYVMSSRNDEQLLGVWRSTDKGNSWEQIAFNSPELGILASQGFWNNVIAVDPENKNRIFAAGLSVWEYNYNGNWKQISSLSEFYSDKSSNPYYVHADCHNITFDTKTTPYGMYITNDGGVFKSNNKGITYTQLNKNYNVTQFYSVAANSRGEIIGGTQDNNTILLDGKRNDPLAGIRTLGGDGFRCEASRLLPDAFFAANPGGFERSLNRGQSWNEYFDPNISAQGAFIPTWTTPYLLWEAGHDPALQDTTKKSMLFMAGVNTLWMTEGALNFNDIPTWFKVADFGGAAKAIDFTRSGNTVFVGTFTGALYRISGFRGPVYKYVNNVWDWASNGITVEQITLPASIGGRGITGIGVHPKDSNRVVITCGNYGNSEYVYLSTNAMDANVANVSFTSIQSNLPKMPVYDAIINIDDPNHIILGTDLGIWASSNSGASWTEQNNGATRAPVFQIRQYEFKPWEGPVIYAATHGRGIFRSRTFITGRSETPVAISKSTVKAYPNPAREYTNVEFTLNKSVDAVVTVVDINGKTVFQKNMQNLKAGIQKLNISTSELNAGNYFVRVEAAAESAFTRFVVIK